MNIEHMSKSITPRDMRCCIVLYMTVDRNSLWPARSTLSIVVLLNYLSNAKKVYDNLEVSFSWTSIPLLLLLETKVSSLSTNVPRKLAVGELTKIVTLIIRV